MSTKPMVRRRGSIAEVMNALSSGSSSSRSVCGLGPLTSAINNSFARAREMRASSSFLMSLSCIGGFAFVGSAPPRASRLFSPRHKTQITQKEKKAADNSSRKQTEDDVVIMIRDHQRLMEGALCEPAENEPDDEADERVAVTPQEIAEEAEEDRDEHIHHVALVGIGAEQRDDQEHRRQQLDAHDGD